MLVNEIKTDKISLEDTLIHKEIDGISRDTHTTDSYARNEAVEALVALGYSPSDALKAIKKAEPPEDADVETILKLALKNMF